MKLNALFWIRKISPRNNSRIFASSQIVAAIAWISGVLFSVILISGCNKSDNDLGNCGDVLDWSTLYQSEAQNLIAASSAYSQDQSPANCAAYKEAYIEYVNGIRRSLKCIPTVSKDYYEQEIKESEIEIAQLCQ